LIIFYYYIPMNRIHLRSRRKKDIYSKALIILLLIAVLILAKATWNVFVKNKDTRENLAETESKLEDLRGREANLKAEIDALNTERGVDREIRSKFRVAKEGEGMIMLIDSPKSSATTSPSEEKGLWSRILDLF
jgi:cell division protein FtsB